MTLTLDRIHLDRDPSLRAARQQNAGILILGYAVLVFGLFPGRFDYDSIFQYTQGVIFNFSDWLPPLMSLLLGVLQRIVAGPAPMFLVQLTIYFVGVFLITDALVMTGHKHWAHVLSAAMMLPIVSFNFLDVQKDALFCATTMLLVGVFARRIVRPRPASLPELIAVFLVLVLMWDIRKNSLFMLVPLGLGVAYFICRITSCIKAGGVAALLLASSLVTQQALVYDVLPTSREHALMSVLLFDFAGISNRVGTDVTRGLLGPDFVTDANRCYVANSVDNFMPWGPCKQRGLLLQEKFGTPNERNSAIKTWLSAVAKHPVAYLAHRWAHFSEFMRISCTTCPRPMNIGLSTPRPYHLWQPLAQIDFDASLRVTTLGLFLERLATMSYASFWSRGFLWMILLAASIVIVAARWWKEKTDDFDVLAGIAGLSGLIYASGFFFVGVSDSQRYLHVVYALALVSICLALRNLTWATIIGPIRAVRTLRQPAE